MLRLFLTAVHYLLQGKCPEPESNQRHEDFQSSALPTELSGHRLYKSLSCGSRIWTCDLRVMSPTSFQTAPSRDIKLISQKRKADDRTRTDNLLITNQLLCQLSHIGLAVKLSGWRRIRTFESVANRFTVCPLWPLGNPPIVLYGTYRARTYDPLLVRQMLSQLS